MHVIDEIDDSEKPYIEYLAGRAVPKVSPKRRHGMVQGALFAILREQARGRGDVATEWRCYLPAEPRRTSLVPDVAFISNESLAPLTEQEREMPQFAPDIAIEVRSEGATSARISSGRLRHICGTVRHSCSTCCRSSARSSLTRTMKYTNSPKATASRAIHSHGYPSTCTTSSPT